MGVVTVSSSASRSPLGLSTNFSNHSSPLKRPLILAFKGNKRKNTTLISPPKESISLPLDTSKKNEKRPSERVEALSTAEPLPTTSELDYNEAAAKLENLYKLSPPKFLPDTEDKTSFVKKQRGRKRRNKGIIEGDDKLAINVVRGRKRKSGRLSLDKRIELKNKKECQLVASMMKIKTGEEVEEEKINRLVRDYSASNDLVSLDWKKVKIPPVLPSSENAWLFKLMQPMKAILQTKDNLEKELQREPTDGEQAEATNMSVVQLRKHMEVGRAARNKLIKHNLRLVLFVINKYFQEFVSGPKFQDLCQAGVKGLITAIDRFELKRKFRLSTYGLFWIRHAITRSMTVSSFMRVSFGLDSLRVEIQRAKLELLFELHRMPTEEEIIKKVKISPRRYHEVMNASRPVYSLHSRDKVTQEEFINGITDIDNDNGGGDNKRQSALLRLALDDVLDSLKPKESLVIRQRFGLDGKGDRTLGEIAGNLNISREMVRKYEVKGLMKLKHPTRVDYLRQHLSK